MLRIYGGTSEIMQELVARSLLGGRHHDRPLLPCSAPFRFTGVHGMDHQEIVAKGWGFQMRTYDREEEPVMF